MAQSGLFGRLSVDDARRSSPTLGRVFGTRHFTRVTDRLHTICPTFSRRTFLTVTYSKLRPLSIVRHVTRATRYLRTILNLSCRRSLRILHRLTPHLGDNFIDVFLTRCITHCNDRTFRLSVSTLRRFAHFNSSRFTIQRFLRDSFRHALTLVRS